MKIVHTCLACFYVEGMGYQENLLPKHHVLAGHTVTLITNEFCFDKNYQRQKREKLDYVNKDGVHIRTLKNSTRYGYYSRFGDYEKIYETLAEEQPDVIFVHGGQFVGLKDVIRYCKDHPAVKLYIDQHGDFYNMKVSGIKGFVIHKLIYGHWIRKAVKYATCFWGVTPWRCEYLNKVYGVPKKKIDLLIMGADDANIYFEQKDEIRQRIRAEHQIADDEFMIITGGKIDEAKKIHNLMEACRDLENVKLLVFGSVLPNVKEQFDQALENNKNVIYIGWLDADKVYDYLLASDLIAFPGTHSVLWEQACATKVPGIFAYWAGMQHINNGGNAMLLESADTAYLRSTIEGLIFTPKYQEMKKVAESDATDIFLYSKIAKKALK